MTTDYESIRHKNIKEYGEGSRHLSYLSDIYTTRTHFIFEILQNAEDALKERSAGSPSGYVYFNLYEDRLEISHNGMPFSEKNVIGICGIGEGTKAGDYTQIGKFGIGFKSVYAFTFFPQIHSGDEHFEIRRFVEPYNIDSIESEDTRIILPFDRPDCRPSWAFRENISPESAALEIGDALRELGIRTLLFLRHIEEIKWTLPDGTSGHFIRSTLPFENYNNLRKVEVLDQDESLEEWLIFSRDVRVEDVGKSHIVTVEVAFLLKNGFVTKAQDTQLVVFFPTEKETKLGFFIQAPFKTTKARDNIKSDDAANELMIQTAAELAADSLTILRDMGRMNIASFNAFPIRLIDFRHSLFECVYERIREALKTQPLLPGQDGDFIKAVEAKLARGKELVELFSSEQLSALFGKKKLNWIDTAITENGETAGFYVYLVGRKKGYIDIEPLIEGLQVEADTLAPKLTVDFLKKQEVDWLVRFVLYAKNILAMRKVPFIRLESGEQVSLPENKSVSPTAWFAPKDASDLDLTVFPLVHAELVNDGEIRSFLAEKGIREIDAAAIVEKSILPKFQEEQFTENFEEKTYADYLRHIKDAYNKSDELPRNQLINSLKTVFWLACNHSSGKSEKIVWKKTGDTSLFARTRYHEIWFEGLEFFDAYFLHHRVNNELGSDLVKIMAKPVDNLVKKRFSDNKRYTNISSNHGNHVRGLNGFDPDWEVIGLEPRINSNLRPEQSVILWDILKSNYQCIKGTIEKSTRQNFENPIREEEKLSTVGILLSNSRWLPDNSGNFYKPTELLLTDLPDEFENTSVGAREVAEKLGMKKPEVEQALELITEGDKDLVMLIDSFKKASEADKQKMLKIIPKEIPPQPAPLFKTGLDQLTRPQRGIINPHETSKPIHSVGKPDRYQDKINTETEERIRHHEGTPQTISFSVVREASSNKSARHFLYEQYQGKCQITGFTFPKASANADGDAVNYFEACALLSYSDADYLNNEGNMLSVSADTMAKFKHASFEWIDDFETTIETFTKRTAGEIEDVKVKIRLAGEECEITWSERHFARLVALYQADNSYGGNS
ncbi:hypothetical protein [Methylotuvimicrobium sp. KM2]|uniref:sacsin N-terminal ATP-binding-like domain-containing protein n=1 Tax=Methylotuvimicrobium sp. KM2 TaxID=3133976 RepID=UPI003101355C